MSAQPLPRKTAAPRDVYRFGGDGDVSLSSFMETQRLLIREDRGMPLH